MNLRFLKLETFKDVPKLCVCGTWRQRPAGYNNKLQFRTKKQYQYGFHMWNCKMYAFVVTGSPARTSCAQISLTEVYLYRM